MVVIRCDILEILIKTNNENTGSTDIDGFSCWVW